MFSVLRYGRFGRHLGRAAAPWRISSSTLLLPRRCIHSQAEDEAATSTRAIAPLVYPEQPRSVKHHDLSSFLRHAERTGLDPATTTYIGTHYEYTVAEHLAPLGFYLQRVGGASDKGIDLLGTWSIPAGAVGTRRAPIRVLLQCKAGASQRIGPHLVRELEGAFVGAPVGWRSRAGDDGAEADGSAVIGLLVAERTATKGIRDALTRSRWPMAFICCSNVGHIRQMLWNQRAERVGGLAGLGVALRHAADGKEPHIVLTWQGQSLPPAPEQPQRE